MKVLFNIIYHHDDPDGHFAGAIIKDYLDKLPTDKSYDKVITLTFKKDYMDEFIDHYDADTIARAIKSSSLYNEEVTLTEILADIMWEQAVIDFNLFFTDLSFVSSTQHKMVEATTGNFGHVVNLIWIDHHESSKSAIPSMYNAVKADNKLFIVSNSLCGAALSYIYTEVVAPLDIKNALYFDGIHKFIFVYKVDQEYNVNIILHRDNSDDNAIYSKDIKIPKAIYHLDNYDRWTKEDPDANAFITGIKIGYGYKLDYSNPIYKDRKYLSESFVESSIKMGNVALSYQTGIYKEQSDRIGMWDIDGVKIAYKNGIGNSWNFLDMIDTDQCQYAILGAYHPAGKKWIYSIYSKDGTTNRADLVANGFGGGGHKGAAGFQLDKCVFGLNDQQIKETLIKEYPEAYTAITGNKIPSSGTNRDSVQHKVFLGGTCQFPTENCEKNNWRTIVKQMIPEKYYFDPVVEDWNEESQKIEDRMKEECDIHIYVIYPNKEGGNTYSIYKSARDLATMEEDNCYVYFVDGFDSESNHKYILPEGLRRVAQKLSKDYPNQVSIVSPTALAFELGQIFADVICHIEP